MARIAKALDVLRAQINAKYPTRSKLSDGWIGNAAHQATKSDHNENPVGVVTALDITHDLAAGLDTWKLAEILRQRRDPRVKYVISNGRIFSSMVHPWEWRPYTGPNKHAHHVHISVMGDHTLYDLASNWAIEPSAVNDFPAPPRPVVKPPAGITADMRRRMAKAIVDFEARRVNGKLAVYHPPANDGGGAFEVAGINVKYHPEQANKLKQLIESGRYDQAEASVIEYLLNYTHPAQGWTTDAGVEFYLRDSIFNRGPGGAARILQRALGVTDDGQIGPSTRTAMARLSGEQLLTRLRVGREDYERKVVGVRDNLWTGLVNRWDKALVKAREFQKEQGAIIPPIVMDAIKTGVPTGGTGGAAAWSLWDGIVAHPFLSLLALAALVSVGIFAFRKLKAWRERPALEPVAPTPAIIEAT